MAEQVLVPRFGWTMEKGVFQDWIKKDGEGVRPGDALFSIEADKAIEEVFSEHAGTLRIIPGAVKQGDEVPVGTVIGWILQPNEAMPEGGPAAAAPAAPPAPAAAAPAAPPAPAAAAASAPKAAATVSAAPTRVAADVFASPRARAFARASGVDWRHAVGTGKGGRIRERDVRALVAAGAGPRAAAGTAGGPAVSVLRVAAGAAKLRDLLDGRVALEAGGDRRAVYRALLARLTAAAYRLWSSKRAAPGEPHAAFSVRIGDGTAVASLTDADLQSIGLAAKKLAAPGAHGPAPAEGVDILDLEALGADEYVPGVHPRRPLLCFGRGIADPRRSTITVSLCFDEREIDLPEAARLLDAVRSAVEEPVVMLLSP